MTELSSQPDRADEDREPLTFSAKEMELRDAVPPLAGAGDAQHGVEMRESDSEGVEAAGIEEDDIEKAYQKALAALEEAPWDLDAPIGDIGIDSAPPSAPSVQEAEGLTDQVTGIQEQPLDSLSPAFTIEGSEAISASSGEVTTGATGPRLAAGTERHPRIDSAEYTNVTPAQVIEAALFVGGAPLSAKKICSLLRGSFDAAYVEQAIDGLNDQYVSEGRPYEIRLGDGGYRMELRPEYEKLRQRVYGSGPREVKLSQEILEVLSLVAYRQPITQEEIESHGKQNAGNLLRQLLRRDLVAIQRGDGGRKDVRYLTTPRFLNVFGIGSLDELPQPEDLMRK